MTAPPVLELDGVSKEYPGSPPVVALDRVDLAIHAGDLVAIVGPSGSGKSTLLHVMGTLDRPSAGAVRVEGRDITGCSDAELSRLRARTIGFVFQQFFLLDGSTAVDNVATGLLYRDRNLAPEERRARAAEALERVGLGHRLGHRPGELSGGERQRVAIARALVGNPALVLADEPTGNLDPATGEGVQQRLIELNHEHGSSLVVATHNARLAAAMGRTLRLAEGRLREEHAPPLTRVGGVGGAS